MITKTEIVRWLQAAADVFEENKDYLTDLDAAIGDADHGVNMDRGFQKVRGRLDETADTDDLGAILRTVAMTLISTVGGASGPLYGTMFLRAAGVLAGKTEVEGPQLAEVLKAFVDGCVQRGHARPGEKTMLDSLVPAADAFERALETGAGHVEALHQAVAAAENGARDTIPMIATKGRASYLGPRSAGHQDPGATSAWLLLKTLLETLTL